eukprot:9478782-Pyramimonas_sp.AAC.2
MSEGAGASTAQLEGTGTDLQIRLPWVRPVQQFLWHLWHASAMPELLPCRVRHICSHRLIAMDLHMPSPPVRGAHRRSALVTIADSAYRSGLRPSPGHKGNGSSRSKESEGEARVRCGFHNAPFTHSCWLGQSPRELHRCQVSPVTIKDLHASLGLYFVELYALCFHFYHTAAVCPEAVAKSFGCHVRGQVTPRPQAVLRHGRGLHTGVHGIREHASTHLDDREVSPSPLPFARLIVARRSDALRSS